MECELPRSLSEFDSQLRIIDSVWLRKEINLVRPQGISEPGFSQARKDAQVKPSTNLMTLNEAIRVIFVCLYKPNKKPLIKKLIDGPNLSAINPLKLDGYVDSWIQHEYKYARDLVIKVYQLKLNLSVEEVKAESKKLGVTLDLGKLRQLLRLPRKKRLRSKTILSAVELRLLALNLQSLSK